MPGCGITRPGDLSGWTDPGYGELLRCVAMGCTAALEGPKCKKPPALSARGLFAECGGEEGI